MESLYRYYLQALELDRAAFVAQHRHMFLLKRPAIVELVDGGGGGDDDEGQYEDEPTQLVSLRQTSIAGLRAEEPQAAEWRVAVARKVSTFPPFNRIVVGRSKVCDVTVPHLPVSKVHVYLTVEEGRVAYATDQRSANGTFLNGRRLDPGETVPVKSGDALRLGSVELDLLDAGGFYDFLKKHG